MSLTLHVQTPTLSVSDPRGLNVRVAAYHRAVAGEASARITHQLHDVAGRPIASRDPRLFALWQSDRNTPANQSTLFSLSGQALRTHGVDAGWRVNLPGEAGQTLIGWDGRGSCLCTEYDPLLRPVALFERGSGAVECCVERLSYGDASADAVTHNLCGQLWRHDDPSGSRAVNDYSLAGAVLSESRRFLLALDEPDWPESEPERDALLEDGGAATTRWTYSALGEVLSQIDAQGHTQGFAYTVAGQLKATRLQLKEQAPQLLVSDITYNVFGQVETETAGNGVISRQTYDPADGRLLRLSAARAGQAILQDLEYAYDPVGNITRVEDHAQATRYFANQRIDSVNTYAYDSLYQLIAASGREAVSARPFDPDTQATGELLGNYSQTYTYDAGHNLTQVRHHGTQSYTRDMAIAASSNRALPISDEQPNPDLVAGFDSNGNLRALQPGQGLVWDLRNRLHQVTPVVREAGPDDSERYAYDGSGMRVRKLRLTQAKQLIHSAEVRYLPGLEIRTNTTTGEVLQVISVSAGRSSVRVLHWEQNKPEEMVNDQPRYGLSDHLGSSTVELDHEGRLISQEGYYPYGGTAWWTARNGSEAPYKTIRYSGKERDATGLYYYGFRYYAPWLHRWINPDPAGDVDGLNVYRFVQNNPISSRDALGLVGEGSTFSAQSSTSNEIPKEVNWIWLGKPLPKNFAFNINDFLYYSPEYRANATLWVDKASYVSGHAEALQNLSSSVNIKNVEELFKGQSKELISIFTREASGSHRNYAAASDVGRLVTLLKGGLYLDLDVQREKRYRSDQRTRETDKAKWKQEYNGILDPQSLESRDKSFPFPSLRTTEEGGLLSGSLGGNAVLAATPNSKSIKEALEHVVTRYYQKNTDQVWGEKRNYFMNNAPRNRGRIRVELTVSMSGPATIRDRNEFSEELFHAFSPLNGDGQSIMKPPVRLRRNSF